MATREELMQPWVTNYDYTDLINKAYVGLGQPSWSPERSELARRATVQLADPFLSQYQTLMGKDPTSGEIASFVGSTFTPDYARQYALGLNPTQISSQYIEPYLQNLSAKTQTGGMKDQLSTIISDALAGRTAGGAKAEQYFQDYMGNIAAPSSVDEVQRQIESDILKQTLGEIGRGTEQNLATAKLDFGERGLLGPGRTSDIVENALAQIRTGGERTAAGARSQLALGEIGRMKAKIGRAH